MSIDKKEKLTTANIAEKANLIWEIATHIVGLYKPHEYGKVILPFTVLKRFDDALKDTKQEVIKKNDQLKKDKVIDVLKDTALKKVAKHDFYNVSKFDFEKLVADSENIESNFNDYMLGFSDNVKDILENFEFSNTIKTLVKGNKLFIVIQEFNSKKADMSPDKITSADMGYIFEELIRKFSESYDEQAGAHFTSRDVIYLMTELLVSPEKSIIKKEGCNKTVYDMAMGTSQMLGCLEEKVKEINDESTLNCFGQEFNPETYAIAKSDMLIKGGNANGMKFGDTLNNDQFKDMQFDYIISNPPFGIDWKSEREAVEKEAKLGFNGRFGAGLPAISDGQMLFLQNGVKKLKDTGRMAIIQNGSSLFTGDAGSGPSEIRKYLISDEDMIEAIIQLPNDLFYNTGISTYIWVLSHKNNESKKRIGKVQLIDASKCFVKRKKNIGNKRVDLNDTCIKMIVKAYNEFNDEVYTNDELVVESKVFDNEYFGYTKVTVETAEVDKNGNKVMKKDKPVVEKGKTDYETIPLNQDIDEYFAKEVLPYNNLAFMDRSKDKIGYEIPFTRIFYKFVPPRKSEEIFEELKELSLEESKLMKEILNG